MQKSSSASTSNQGYKAPKQRFNRSHFAKPYSRGCGHCHTEVQLTTVFFSQQPGTKGCPHQTTHSNPEGLMKDKVREQATPIVDVDFLHLTWSLTLKQVVFKTI